MRKVFGWAAIAFLVWFVAANPAAAADLARSLAAGAEHVASGFGTALSGVVK